MGEEHDLLAAELKSLFNEAVDDFKTDLKDKAKEFLLENAKQFAKYTVLANKAETDEEIDKHRSTLRHLIAQAVAEATKEYMVQTEKAGNLLSKVVGVIGGFVERLTPSIVGKIGL